MTTTGDFVKICRPGGVLSKNKFLVVAVDGLTGGMITVRKDSPTAWMEFSPVSWVRVAAPVRRAKGAS